MNRSLTVGLFLTATLVMACAGGGRFASPVASLAGCYALNFGPWPGEMRGDGALEEGYPTPAALPSVIELATARVGRTDDASVDGRIHEVRSHGRPGRGVLHYWRMVKSDSLVVWTGGPVGFRLEMAVTGQETEGAVFAFSEASGAEEIRAALSGVRSPCPRQAVPGA